MDLPCCNFPDPTVWHNLKVPAVWKLLSITCKLVDGDCSAVCTINDFLLYSSWNLVKLSTGWRVSWGVWHYKMMAMHAMSASVWFKYMKTIPPLSFSSLVCFETLHVSCLRQSLPTQMHHCWIFKTIVFSNSFWKHLWFFSNQANVMLKCNLGLIVNCQHVKYMNLMANQTMWSTLEEETSVFCTVQRLKETTPQKACPKFVSVLPFRLSSNLGWRHVRAGGAGNQTHPSLSTFLAWLARPAGRARMV